MHIAYIGEFTIAIKASILKDDRNVVNTIGLGQTQLVGNFVFNNQQPGKSTINLLSGRAHGVSMVPEGCRFLLDGKVREPGRSRCNRLPGTTVPFCRQVDTVPVKCRFFLQVVIDLDLKPLVVSDPDGWTQEISVITISPGIKTGKKTLGSLLNV